jgi:FSR family fosmidomycin resistance protein-like MFS transporter
LPRYLPIVCLALMHGVVDAVAMFIEPLWPELRTNLKLSQGDLFLLLAITAIAPNFSQIVFGFVQDRFGSRYLLWLGPAVAAVCLTMLGLAGSVTSLALLVAVGYVAIGSFHPEAAVYAGQLLPEQRTRAISLFMFGGTMGLGLGPILSGNLVKRFDPAALAWLALPALALVAVIHILSRRAVAAVEIPHGSAAHPDTGPLSTRLKLAAFLLLVCSLRVVPNTGMTKALAFTLEARGSAADVIGAVQSLFLVCGSLGILLVGSRFGHGHEKRLMIYGPLAAIPPIIAMTIPGCPTWLLVGLLVPAGLALTGTTPAMVSYAHQLFPRDTGMASALTMGLSWGTSGLIVAAITPVFVEQLRQPALLFAAFVPCLAVAGLGACLLPRIETDALGQFRPTIAPTGRDSIAQGASPGSGDG